MNIVDAAWSQQWEEVELMIRSGCRLDVTNSVGQTALMAACYYQNTKMVDLMFESGASCDQGHHDGYTPLMDAAQLGKINVVKQLLRLGANHQLERSDGMTALAFASRAGYPEIVEILSEKSLKASDKIGSPEVINLNTAIESLRVEIRVVAAFGLLAIAILSLRNMFGG